jgi:hypothetical protein
MSWLNRTDPINFFQAMYFPPIGSIATFRGFPRHYTRFSPAELAAFFPHHQARGGVVSAPPVTSSNPSNPTSNNPSGTSQEN